MSGTFAFVNEPDVDLPVQRRFSFTVECKAPSIFRYLRDGKLTMKGTLEDRPVGLSSTQFECAQEHGPAFWLYVVERAGSLAPRLVRIQDPAGKAESFMLDHGWKAVAQVTDLPAPPAQ